MTDYHPPFDATWQQPIYNHAHQRQLRRSGETNMIRLCLTVMVVLLTGFSFLTAALSTLARHGDSAVDLFTSYTDLLQRKLSPEFICEDITPIQDEFNLEATRQLCTLYPAKGVFSKVQVLIGDRFYQARFTPRGGILVLGHLASLWGQPEFRSVYRGEIVLRWPSQGMTVVVDNHFSYFLPVERIIFTSRAESGYLVGLIASVWP